MSDEDAVSAVLGDWYARGAPEDPEALIRAHPHLEAPLRAALLAGAEVDLAFGRTAGAAEGTARTIGGYRVVREIGRGGMGIVYEAEQVELRRRVALKVLHPAVAPSREAVERFRREARAAARFVHPHVVPVHEMGEADGVLYYAMEWVRGTTLARVVEERRRARAGGAPAAPSALGSPTDGPAYFERLAGAAADVAEGLHAAHEAGIVHRDVKPANLLLDAAGSLRVMDFGVARVDDDASRTVTGALVGTPAYMSPEQAGGGHLPLDARTDVYSLGASLYEVLTLHPPFDGRDPYAVCLKVLSKDPVRPRRRDPSIPKDLETIVAKAMEKDPDRRYASAQALADDLRAFAQGRPIRARRAGPLARALRGARRPATLAVLGVLALAIVGVLTARALGAGRSSGAPEREGGAPAASPWTALPPVPVASYGLGCVVLGGRLYAVSGYFTPRVAVYDPAVRAWHDVAPLPRAIQYAGIAVAQGRIHVFGGDTGGWGPLDTTFTYDPATDAWTPRAPMPGGARYAVGAAELGGKVYVVGGTDRDGGAIARVEAFDPVAGTWEARSPLPLPRAVYGAVGAIAGRLYVAGGNLGHSHERRVDAYDPASDAWTSKAPLPLDISAQAAVVGGRLVLAGGSVGDDERAVVAYDPAVDTWTALPPLRRGRHGHGAAYDPASNVLYAVSGGIAGDWLTSVETWTPTFAR